MATSTKNLELVMPILNDGIHQTINDLANNFKKIDDAAELYMNNPPTSGSWNQNKKVYKKQPVIGDYIGWINIRSGEAAHKWTPLTAYTVGNTIVPNSDNGHYYECTQSGRSGVNDPNFPTTSNGVVKDILGHTTWLPNKLYNLNEIVVPTLDNNRFYLCTVSGTSGTAEPNWSQVDGTSVDDSGVVWISYRITTWKEKGTSANFRPFGKIE
ncbi:hypothetical protein NV379_02685 [Paenibacillus sp. N1-5-1-14]|uniref:hypothetical protein n=1 Tax=Paenibacillus radicibacter TaxID=2972488 RepID=UPI002159374D|nr:hypothetical protein [Paenibacillus radicibacter]MCR8641553.1 hypothetical protein [Paenibacillus radicibacter]